jgi:hypothetical protein
MMASFSSFVRARRQSVACLLCGTFLLSLGACSVAEDFSGSDSSWTIRDDAGSDAMLSDPKDAGADALSDREPDSTQIDAEPPDAQPADADADGVADEDDNCPAVANPDQNDTDGDGRGDVCDSDQDGDAIDNQWDNCPRIPNPDQNDFDNDGQGNVCDDDDDGDGVDDASDNCPRLINPVQADRDADDVGNACDDFYRVGSADTVFESNAGWASYASHANFVGDINGDGFEDMVVTRVGGSGGANGGSNGKNYLFFGEPNRSPVLTPAAADVEFVRNVDAISYSDMAIGVGDVNADGFDDILVVSVRQTSFLSS